MSENNERILDKIRKCLALAESNNPHEAANALRQAQLLMQKHGISTVDVELAEISEYETSASGSTKVAKWEHQIITAVISAFGVKVLFRRGDFKGETLVRRSLLSSRRSHWRPKFGKGKIVFVGPKARAEVANYAYETLRRQLAQARKAFRKERIALRGVCTPAELEMFCYGWAAKIAMKTAPLTAPFDDTHKTEQYMDRRYGDLESAKTRGQALDANKMTSGEIRSFIAGSEAGDGIQLNAGVAEGEAQRQIGVTAAPPTTPACAVS